MPEDLDLLQGSWTVTAIELEGQRMPAAMLGESRIVVEGRRFTSTGMGAVYGGVIALDVTTSPRRIDLQFDSGPEKGNINQGIYELEGDRWKLCLNTRGGERPSSFASAPGTGFAFETLARGVAAAEPPRPVAASGHSTEFDGEWKMVSGVMNGQAMDASVVQWVRRATEGGTTTVYAGPQVMMKFQFTSDPKKKTIDYVNVAGANQGKSQAGIYAFEDGLLKVCVSAPGAARPTEFESVRGDGRTFTVWKRA